MEENLCYTSFQNDETNLDYYKVCLKDTNETDANTFKDLG